MTIKPITAGELRIGNLVFDSTRTTTLVESIIPEHGRIRYGIPLTEEWLVKAGFENISPCWCKGTFTLATKVDKDSTPYFSTSSFMIDIIYIHQLQNLYFALTQTELTFKR